MDAQTAFLNDMSKSFFHSFQQMCDLNIKLVQTMLEETALASQQLLTADRQSEILSAATARAQPATEKLRAYQQHISRLAADSQVDMARVTEQHVETTSRTARALADEVARTASEETERSLRKQQETARQFADPFMGQGDGSAQQGRKRGDGAAGASMQSGQQGMSQQGMGQQGQQGQPGMGQQGQQGQPGMGQQGQQGQPGMGQQGQQGQQGQPGMGQQAQQGMGQQGMGQGGGGTQGSGAQFSSSSPTS